MLRTINITLILLLLGCMDSTKPQTHRFVALNTTCSITLFSPKEINLIKVEEIVRDFENRISFHLDGSQISKINEKSGNEYYEADSDIVKLIEKALYYGDVSQGFFDPTIGPLSRLWGIGTKNYLPNATEVDEVKDKVNYKRVLINGNRVKLQDKGMKIDLGGIAKGYISDIIKKYLLSQGVNSGIINLGGNITLIGDRNGERSWKVGIQSPSGVRGKELGILEVKDINIISSGSYERNFEQEGKIYHHILNPFTGYPKEGEIVASTIVSNFGVDGDALSTITFGSNLHEVLKLREELKFEGIFVLKDQSVYVTEKIRDNFALKDNRYRLIDGY